MQIWGRQYCKRWGEWNNAFCWYGFVMPLLFLKIVRKVKQIMWERGKHKNGKELGVEHSLGESIAIIAIFAMSLSRQVGSSHQFMQFLIVLFSICCLFDICSIQVSYENTIIFTWMKAPTPAMSATVHIRYAAYPSSKITSCWLGGWP
jgi:hypothetical protein